MTWDVLPAADLLTQDFGCTAILQEWVYAGCPSRRFHSGVDLGHHLGGAHIYRSPVFATRSGVVCRIGDAVGLGDQAVCVQLDAGGWLWYGHLEAALVLNGEHVRPGQDIGLVGSRGLSTAPHLHLEHRLDGPTRFSPANGPNVANPAPFLYAGRTMTEDQVIGWGHLAHLMCYGSPMDPATQQSLVGAWKAGQLNMGNQFASWYGDGMQQGRAYPVAAPATTINPFRALITPQP